VAGALAALGAALLGWVEWQRARNQARYDAARTRLGQLISAYEYGMSKEESLRRVGEPTTRTKHHPLRGLAYSPDGADEAWVYVVVGDEVWVVFSFDAQGNANGITSTGVRLYWQKLFPGKVSL